jgi:hypothetical protein
MMSEPNEELKKPPQRIRHKKERVHAHRAEKAKARKRAKMEQKKLKARGKQGKRDR